MGVKVTIASCILLELKDIANTPRNTLMSKDIALKLNGKWNRLNVWRQITGVNPLKLDFVNAMELHGYIHPAARYTKELETRKREIY